MHHQHVSFDTHHAIALAGSTGLGALIGDRFVAGLVAFFFSLLAMVAAEVGRPWIQHWIRRARLTPPPEAAPELAARPTVAPPPPPAP